MGDIESNFLVGSLKTGCMAVWGGGGENSSCLAQVDLGAKRYLLNTRWGHVSSAVFVRCINLHLRLLCSWKPPPIPCLLAGSVVFGRCLLVTSALGWLSFFVTPLLEWAEHLEESLGVHVAEILQLCCDSPRAAAVFAGGAEQCVWEVCELLWHRSALSAVLQRICRSLGRGNHSSLPRQERRGFCFCK